MKKETICLVTGGRWHYEAYKFLKKKNYNVLLLDDNKNCYLKKKFKYTKINSLKNIKKFKKFFFWSPCNDLGSHLSDKYNYQKYNVRTEHFSISNNKKEIAKKLDFKPLKFKDLNKKKIYLKKPIYGSGSRGISFYDKKKKINNKKYFIQEFRKGYEISAEIYSFKSKHKIISLNLRILKSYKSAVCIFTLDIKKKIKDLIQNKIDKIYKKLKVINGISHLEIILDDKNKIYPIDVNFRLGGAGVSDYLIKNTLKLNPYEIDFNTLKNSNKMKNTINHRYGMLIYENKKNEYLKKELKFYSHLGYYEKLKDKKVVNNYENDENRVSLLYLNLKSKKEIQKKIEIIFSKKKIDEILNQLKYLSNRSFK